MKEKKQKETKKKNGIYKRLHRWPGLIISFILFYYGITGIIMNHRDLISGIDVKRSLLPSEYEYHNWNNAALKGSLMMTGDSNIVYGNIGIWSTDSGFTGYRSMNRGFHHGTDNRRVADIHLTENGELYAATLFGLYTFDSEEDSWKLIIAKKGDKRFTAVESRGDTLYALSRSYIYTGISAGSETKLNRYMLPAPEGYKNKAGLFETVWQIHSGEIFGLPGQLFVDLLGLITVFLSVTGMIYFFFPGWIVSRMKKARQVRLISNISKWSLKWHNKFGAWFFVFLVILYFTGIFLRPPLLLTIATSKVKPVMYSTYVEISGRPVGELKISGLVTDSRGRRYISEYDQGMIPLGHNGVYPPMPSKVKEDSLISLWSVALEIHTGRIFNSLIGSFYILVVPLAGLTGITVVLSGYLLWRKKYRKHRADNIRCE